MSGAAVSDRGLAQLCAATYEPGVSWAFAGPTFHATLTELADGSPAIAIEGSHSWGDWVADLDVIGLRLFEHPDIGPVHAAFDQTTDECFPEIVRALKDRPPATLTGHSKGGGEAEMLAVKLAIAGIAVARVVTFGAPRWVAAGNAKVAPLLPARLGMAYRHFYDVVTQVPPLRWTHPTTRPPVRIGSGGWLDRLRLGWMHSIDSYIAALPAGGGLR